MLLPIVLLLTQAIYTPHNARINISANFKHQADSMVIASYSAWEERLGCVSNYGYSYTERRINIHLDSIRSSDSLTSVDSVGVNGRSSFCAPRQIPLIHTHLPVRGYNPYGVSDADWHLALIDNTPFSLILAIHGQFNWLLFGYSFERFWF